MLLQGIEILAFLSSEWAVTIRLQSKGPDLIDNCSSSTLVQRLISALSDDEKRSPTPPTSRSSPAAHLPAGSGSSSLRHPHSFNFTPPLPSPPTTGPRDSDGNYEVVTDAPKYKWLQNIPNTSDSKIFQDEYAPLHKQFNGSLCLDLLLYHSTYSTIFMNSHLHK